jgi:hypothetical protein
VEASLSNDANLLRRVIRTRPVWLQREDFNASTLLEGGAAKFDFVFSHSILSHAAHWQLKQFLSAIAAVLHPSGVAIASIYFHALHGDDILVGNSHDESWVYPGVSTFDPVTVIETGARESLVVSVRPEIRAFVKQQSWWEDHDWVSFSHTQAHERWGVHDPLRYAEQLQRWAWGGAEAEVATLQDGCSRAVVPNYSSGCEATLAVVPRLWPSALLLQTLAAARLFRDPCEGCETKTNTLSFGRPRRGEIMVLHQIGFSIYAHDEDGALLTFGETGDAHICITVENEASIILFHNCSLAVRNPHAHNQINGAVVLNDTGGNGVLRLRATLDSATQLASAEVEIQLRAFKYKGRRVSVDSGGGSALQAAGQRVCVATLLYPLEACDEATQFQYARGIAALAQSLRETSGDSMFEIVVIVPVLSLRNIDSTDNNSIQMGSGMYFTAEVRALLAVANATPILVPRALMFTNTTDAEVGLPRLGARVWSKLYLWTLTQFDVIVYVDADSIFLQPLSLILSVVESARMEPGDLAAVGEYSQGSLLVIRPSLACFAAMKMTLQLGRRSLGPGLSFPLAEQDYLNMFFASAKHVIDSTWLCGVKEFLIGTHTATEPCVVYDFSGQKPWQFPDGDAPQWERLWASSGGPEALKAAAKMDAA